MENIKKTLTFLSEIGQSSSSKFSKILLESHFLLIIQQNLFYICAFIYIEIV